VSETYRYSIGPCMYCGEKRIVRFPRDLFLWATIVSSPRQDCPRRDAGDPHVIETGTMTQIPEGAVVIWQEETCE